MALSSVEEMVNIVMNYCTHFIKDICLISLQIHASMFNFIKDTCFYVFDTTIP